MTEEIRFEDIPDKAIPFFEDKAVEAEVIEKLEKKQIKEEVIEQQTGTIPPPTSAESVPKELPAIIFRFGSKALDCPWFMLDDEEARALAKHLSILIGAQNSKVYSVFVIAVIVLGKFYNCIDAVKRRFGKKDEKGNPV